jgi:F-type H+-transporting ATPase subunit a
MFLARIATVLMLLAWVPLALAQEATPAHPHADKAATGENNHTVPHEKGLTPYAPVLFYGIGGHPPTDPHDLSTAKYGPLAVTNSMFVAILVALLIILVAQLATRKVQLIPSGLQNFVEYLVEGLYGFFESIVGPKMVKQTFWFFGTIFIFILFSNWFGLLPGMGSMGWGMDDHGHFAKPLLRGVNADLNMTLAMASLFMVLWLYWSLKALGPGGFAGHIFNVKGHGAGIFGLFLVAVFIFVGLIEIVSIGVRPVALTFRLYGNIFAGENILETVMKLGGPYFGWLAVLPFYLLEILVGLVQALVFALLTSVFTALMCEHHGDDHSEENAH